MLRRKLRVLEIDAAESRFPPMPTQPVRTGARGSVFGVLGSRRPRARRRRSGAWILLRHFPRILPFLRPHWKLVVVSTSLIFGYVLLGLATPWTFAIVVDNVLGRRPLTGMLQPVLGSLSTYQLLTVVIVGGLLLNAFGHALRVVDNYVNTKLDLYLTLDFRSALYAHAQRLAIRFYDRVPTGQILYRLGNQAGSLGDIVLALPPLLQASITAIGMFAIAVLIDWQLALLSLVVLPLLVYSTQVYAKRIQPRLYKARNLEAATQSMLVEAFQMIRVIMAFGRETHEYGRWRRQSERAIDARIDLTIRQTLYGVVLGVTTAVGSATIVGVGAVGVLHHRLTLGELTVLLGYVAAIYSPLTQVSTTFGGFQQQFVNLESALTILDTPVEIADRPGAISIARARGRVRFDAVDFAYPTGRYEMERRREIGVTDAPNESEPGSSALPENIPRRMRELLASPGILDLYEKARAAGLNVEPLVRAHRRPALTGVSFEIASGQHVAIVGPTGAGKTTIVNLLLRFYDPQRGAVLVDDVDLRDLKLASLREHISIVPQEPLLFQGTIADNIRYGNLDATDDDVVEAARAANIHDFISELPDDYDTVVGETGSLLSGGERQRISVARAFLKDAPILVLDEPTSSIDSRTEAVILAALDRLMEGRTTFTIAHRLSTVRRADKILVMDEGKLVQQGRHEELLGQPGLYRRLHDIQLGLAAEPVEAGGRSARAEAGSQRQGVLLLGNLLVAGLATLLEDGSTDDLRALMDCIAEQGLGRTGTRWWLVGAILAAVRDDSLGPLRELARRADARPAVAGVALSAANLLENRHVLHAIWEKLQRSPSNRNSSPLDHELLMREPWTALARVSPDAAKIVASVWPTGELNPFAVPPARADLVHESFPPA